jgi:hypothetical protein
MASEPSFPEVPEPNPPSTQEVERMRAHRREEHGEDFDLGRDVSYGGNVSETAPLTYTAATPAGPAAYHCRDCPGSRFTLDDPYIGTPERRAHLRRFDPQLRTLLANVDRERQDAFIDRYERRLHGALAPVPVDPAPRRRAATARRIERCQDFLLQRRLVGRTIVDAIDDLIDLHDENRRLYVEIVGDATLYAPETFRCYYKELPEEKKTRARETYKRLRASGEAKPKYRKFTG